MDVDNYNLDVNKTIEFIKKKQSTKDLVLIKKLKYLQLSLFMFGEMLLT